MCDNANDQANVHVDVNCFISARLMYLSRIVCHIVNFKNVWYLLLFDPSLFCMIFLLRSLTFYHPDPYDTFLAKGRESTCVYPAQYCIAVQACNSHYYTDQELWSLTCPFLASKPRNESKSILPSAGTSLIISATSALVGVRPRDRRSDPSSLVVTLPA